ncbi:MAG: L-aspartate oxidase [Melioribacteraceae bacterium]|nr:L-aspartate oxidase [Melioribacteraceae bacterium]
MKKQYDFLIIGSGLAGLMAAYHASNYGTVAILTKAPLDISNSYMAQGGIAAALSEDDSVESHYEDTITAGRGICNKEAVKVLVSEGKERVQELIRLGMKFDYLDGKIAFGQEGGHSHRRILHAGDLTGKALVNFVFHLVKQKKIDIYEKTLIHELIEKNGVCLGAFAYDIINRKNITFVSQNTILATGGASGIFNRTTNPNTATGDGIALAYNAGAKVSGLEFIQFHPTGFYTEEGESFLITEAIRGEGAYILNHDKQRFMSNYHQLSELAPRDIVSRAIFDEMKKSDSKFLYLSLAHLDSEKIKNRFSNIYRELKKYNLDLTKDMIPITPAAHYVAGGIKTNLDGESNIIGLFACGECASTGIHGANRLASNSLLECLVFSKRAVDKAKKRKLVLSSDVKDHFINITDINKEEYFRLKNELKTIMSDEVGIIRSEESIKRALNKFEEIDSLFDYKPDDYYSEKLRDLLTVCRLTATAALTRKESRGGHLRSDYENKDDKFLANIVQQKNCEPKFEEVN